MANYLGQMPSDGKGFTSALTAISNAVQQQRAQRQAIAMELIKSGQYTPTPAGQQPPKPGLIQGLSNQFLGPQPGGQNMNVMGQNYQQVDNSPQGQAQRAAEKMTMTMKALRDAETTQSQGQIGTSNTGSNADAQQVYQPPSVHIDSDGNASYEIKPVASTKNKYAIPPDSLKGQVNAVLSGKKAPLLLSKYGGANSMYAQVMNEVYKKNPNFDENESNINYTAERGNVSALEKAYSNTRAFERTALGNAQIALSYSNKVDRTGSPLLNKAFLSWKNNIQGDADTAAFLAAVDKFSTEWAKVTTNNGANGNVTDTASENNRRVMNAAQTPKQFREVLKVAQQEMRNRNIGYQKSILEARQMNKGLFDNIDESKDMSGSDMNTYGSEDEVQSALDSGDINYGDTVSVNGKKFKVMQ